jgi:hypothetical protein
MKLTRENRRTRRKTCPSPTLSTTNPTWTDPESNPILRGPATNRLNHGTAYVNITRYVTAMATEGRRENSNTDRQKTVTQTDRKQ